MADKNTLDLTALSEYINERKEELFVKSAVGADTLDWVELMLGVKHSENLHYLDSEVVFQGAECGWTPQGSDTIGTREISVVPVEIEKEWCYLDFKNYYMNYQLRFAAGRESLPFEEKFVQSNLEAIKMALENLVWNGDSGLTIDGFIAQIEDEGEVIEVGSGSTATEKIDAAVASATARMLAKGVYVFVSPTDFRNYVLESNGTCCAGRPIMDAAAKSITYVGDSRVTIIPVAGLEDSGNVVIASKDALVYATDIENSEAIYELFFDRKAQTFNFRVLFNAGTAVKFPDEVKIVEEAGA